MEKSLVVIIYRHIPAHADSTVDWKFNVMQIMIVLSLSQNYSEQ